MIDSSSQGNVIKIDFLASNYKVNYLDKIWIKGISKEPLSTLGSVSLKIFDQIIKFYGIQNESEISYDGLLGVEFLNKNKVALDFMTKSLNFNNIAMSFKQNGVCNGTNGAKRTYSVNHCYQDRSSPLINIASRQMEHMGELLLDTDSEGNLVKISSLPLDCDIDTKNITCLKGIGGEVIPTLGLAEFTIFGYTTSFQVVSEDFPIPYKGILNVEYFEKSRAMLDFGLRLLKNGEKYSEGRDEIFWKDEFNFGEGYLLQLVTQTIPEDLDIP